MPVELGSAFAAKVAKAVVDEVDADRPRGRSRTVIKKVERDSDGNITKIIEQHFDD